MLRVAFFTDSLHEANGVATLSNHFAAYAKERRYPFLLVHGGSETQFTREESFEQLELKRGPAAFPLDKALYFDPFLMRHRKPVIDRLRTFRPDLLHVTGPGDLGFLGLSVAHSLQIPLVASWHTNLHEYLAHRVESTLTLVPHNARTAFVTAVERECLRGFLRFYRTARFTLAPNQADVNLLSSRLGRPSFLMGHGVDLAQYSPETKNKSSNPFVIGYVGRLTAEKNVRSFAELERKLIAAGRTDYCFLLVGEGGQHEWLRKNLIRAELPGVLRGSELVAAYRRMDAFVFPSLTDTFGLVILEAMASGVPVVVSPETGRRVGIQSGASGLLSDDFFASVTTLMDDGPLRRRMGASASQFAGSKSWSSVFDQLYPTYKQGLAVPDNRRAAKESGATKGRSHQQQT